MPNHFLMVSGRFQPQDVGMDSVNMPEQRMPQTADELKESVTETFGKGKEKASELLEEAKESTKKIVEEKVEDKVDEIFGD